ncbi:MAG: hypothetical protein JSS34_00990 [Proteobacteria bacterium]|nr:hypothetical protein [Pseudomonadota bacterium]
MKIHDGLLELTYESQEIGRSLKRAYVKKRHAHWDPERKFPIESRFSLTLTPVQEGIEKEILELFFSGPLHLNFFQHFLSKVSPEKPHTFWIFKEDVFVQDVIRMGANQDPAADYRRIAEEAKRRFDLGASDGRVFKGRIAKIEEDTPENPHHFLTLQYTPLTVAFEAPMEVD